MDNVTERVWKAKLPAKIGMTLSAIGGAIVLLLIIFLRIIGPSFGAAYAGLIWWLGGVVLYVGPLIVCFFVFRSLNKKAVDQVRVPLPEVITYGLGPLLLLAPLIYVPDLLLVVMIVFVSAVLLLIWAIWMNQKL